MAYHVWSGNSQITGDPIMVLAIKAATPKSANAKTGDMWQMYILPALVKPTDAIATGADQSVCGNCPHRRGGPDADPAAFIGDCYTYGTTAVAANGSFRMHHDGRSLAFTPDMVTGDKVRLGAYGDPAAVPYEVWETILSASAGHTGYTHQWRDCDPRFRDVVMASCDSIEDMREATARGWRCYTVVPVGTGKINGAVPCPSPRIKCESCLKCDGVGNGRRGNVSIEAHGARAKQFRPTVGRSLPLSVAS